jgi:MFS family permease
LTYLIFQLSNISFNSLYPIFAQAAPPTGRNLDPEEIGLSLGFAGLVTIVFQVGIFGKLRDKMGNRWAYRTGLGGFVIAYILMPWVGYKNPGEGPGAISTGAAWLWIEICFVLLVKTVAAVGGLTSALLLVSMLHADVRW